ncbi:hypothetical protein DTO002I6_4923 [Penicillium roqueforti]|nr:hypothetical protein DTO002I6_4923 [Penicillium roqueforti]
MADYRHYPLSNDVDNRSYAAEKEEENRSGDVISHLADPFGDEHDAEIKYRTLQWWQCGMIMIAETVSLGILSLPSAVAVLGLVPAIILIVGLGIVATYTGYVIGQFKLRYPQVHSMGDAGEVMFHPLGLARFGREFLGTAQLLFLIFVMGSHILTFSVMLDTVTDHGTCSIVFGIVGLVVSFVFALPRTLRKVSWFSFASFASIIAALLITMIAIAIQRPGDGKVDATTTVSLSKAFLAVTNIVFAYAGHVAFFGFISEMETPTDYPKTLFMLQITDTSMYVIAAVVIYIYGGKDVQSPALSSTKPITAKIAYGIAIPTIVIAGVINGHVASKYVYVRLFRSTNHMKQRTFLSIGSWVAISLVLWVIAWIISEAIPVFNTLLSLITSLFASWFTYGLSGIFWLFLNRGQYGASWKKMVLTVVNLVVIGIGACLCGMGLWVSATRQTATKFGVSMEVTLLAVSLFVLGFAFGPIIFGPLSELYGRKLPLFLGMFGFAIFQIPVAVAENLHTIFICRFLGGTFASAPLAIVNGILADMFEPVERGIAMAVFAAAAFIGPVAGPIVGGFITISYLGWRWTEYITAIWAFAISSIGILVVPETFEQTLLTQRAKRLRTKSKNWALHAKAEEKVVSYQDIAVQYLLRPFQMLVQEPILLLITLYMGFIYGFLYTCFVAYPVSFQEQRGWNDGIGALPFVAFICGVFCGCLIIIAFSLTRYRTFILRNGRVQPEERLIPMIIGGILLPVGMFWFGWTSDPHIIWVPQVISGAFLGSGVLLIFLQGLTYIVDVYPMYTNSAMAANSFFRSWLGAGFPMFAPPLFHNLGVDWAMTLLGCLTVALFPVPIAFFIYGPKIRSWSVMGGLLTLESFAETFPQMNTLTATAAQEKYNSTIQGTVVALYTVGGIFGSLSCIQFGDRLGRRKVILFTSFISIIGAVLMATSFSLAQFIVARLVLGYGTGGYVATVPVWQSEISKPSKRGAHVVTDGIFIGAGIAFSLWVDFGFYFVKTNSVSWRFPLVFQVLLSLMVMSFVMLFPESPRWLIKRGRSEEAREILAALDDVDPHSEQITLDIRDIETSLAISGTGSWKDMLKMGEQRLFHRTVLACMGQMFQQMCGINLITFYATTIFEQYLKLSPIQSRVLAASMCLTQPLGGLLAYFTIDRLGRRVLMLWSAVGMSISMAILAGTTSVQDNTGSLVCAVVFLFVFEFIFTVGYSGLTFLYATEVAPLQCRASISAVSAAAVWTFNFLLAEVTPVGFATIDYQYYIIFAVLNAAIVPTVYFFFPETSGRSLEEIDEIFLQSRSIFDPPRIARSLPRMHVADPHGLDLDAKDVGSGDEATGEKPKV